MKNQIRTAKKFVSDHRVALAVTATVIVCGTLQYRNAKVMNGFLKEHNLFDEYYKMEEE